MTNACYPVALCLEGKGCLVVGGGSLAVEKVEGLLRAGALVTVVSERVAPGLVELFENHQIELHVRPYTAADLAGIALAYGADEDRDLNAVVAADARAAGVLVNAVDDIPNCDFYAVSLVRRGDLQVAVSTNGSSPAFARWMREYLDNALPHAFGDLLAALADVRSTVRAAGAVPSYEHWKAAIDDELALQVRRDSETGARERLLDALMPNSEHAGPVSEAAAVA
jgi:precorrin-2 dehydrogenase/sirohydrochlorin ferrochelatase